MKNALILHGTDADHTQNWFPWLSRELTKLGWKVWVPDLPHAESPNVKRYNEYLLDPKHGWAFDNESIIVGHSSGAVEIIGLLDAMKLPDNVKLKTCFLIGAFRGSLGWDSLNGMAEDFDFEVVKSKANKFVFIHSDNDPYCPLDDAKYLAQQLGGELIVIPGQGHFTVSLDPKFTKFPELLDIIKDNT